MLGLVMNFSPGCLCWLHPCLCFQSILEFSPCQSSCPLSCIHQLQEPFARYQVFFKKNLSTQHIFVQGVSRSITFLLTVISLKLFPLLQENLNLSGTFYLYFGVLVFGLPLVMWILPETKDVPIACINDIFVNKPLQSMAQTPTPSEECSLNIS